MLLICFIIGLWIASADAGAHSTWRLWQRGLSGDKIAVLLGGRVHGGIATGATDKVWEQFVVGATFEICRWKVWKLFE